MTDRHPEFEHRSERHGLIGPFSGRQLVAVLGIVVVAAVVLIAATRPLGTVGGAGLVDPRPTAYVLGSPTVGLQPGSLAPELAGTRADGTTWALTDVNGRAVRLADLRGKAVWLNFWASWCPPCRAENPDIQAVYDANSSAGLVVLGIAIGEDDSTVRGYAGRAGLTYTIGLDGGTDIAATYRIVGIPTHFFIDKDGILRDWRIGSLSKDTMATKVAEIMASSGAGAGP